MRTLILNFLLMLMALPAMNQMLTKWNRDYFPESSSNEALIAIDGRENTYICFATTDSQRISLTKLDQTGLPIWNREFGLSGLDWEEANFMFFQDDYLWLIGSQYDNNSSTDNDMRAWKIDTSGTEIFDFYYRTPGAIDYLFAYHLMPNGNLLISQAVESTSPAQEVHLLCYAPNDSTLLWDLVMNPGESAYWPGFINHDDQGNILIHYSAYIGQVMHYYVRKVSPTGSLIWSWDHPYTTGMMNGGFAPDGRTLLSETSFNGGPSNFMQLNTNGTVDWQDSTYGVGGWPSAKATDDHGWIVSGLYGGDAATIKIDSLGAEGWRVIVPDNYGTNVWPMGGTFSPDSSLFYAFYYGSILNDIWSHDFYTIRMTPDGTQLDVTTIPQPPRNDQYQGFGHAFYPNGDFGVFLDRNYAVNYWDRHKMLYRFCTAECMSNFGGKAFADFDANCMQDTSEPKVPYALFELDQGAGLLMSDDLGEFHGSLEPGTHQLEQLLPPYLLNTCPIPNYNFTIDSLTPTAFNLDFGLEIDSNYHDLSVSMHLVNGARPGFSQVHAITYENQGPQIDSGEVSLSLDSIFQFASATPPPSTVSGNTYTWSYAALLPFQHGSIIIESMIPSTTALNVPYLSNVTITSLLVDSDTTNNNDTIAGQTSASFDPNHKSVSPQGIDHGGHILWLDSMLTYTIDFQNVGNDTAFTVAIRDHISEYLDIGSLHVLNSSHPWNMQLQADRNIVWTFNAIMLPDSATNDLRSNGFIAYEIRQLPNLAIGTEIRNQAQIFFDYNSPIQTNEVVNTLGLPVLQIDNDLSLNSGFKIKPFPNPANNTITFRFSTLVPYSELKIFTAQGVEILTGQCQEGDFEYSLDVESLPSGFYYTRIEGENFSATQKWMKL